MHTQTNMKFFSEAPKPVMVDARLIECCGTRLEAIQLCIHLSKLSHEYICSRLGIDKGHWTRMMQGRAHFAENKVETLMYLCGNYAPMQYEAFRMGFALVDPEAVAPKVDRRHLRRA